MKNLILPVLMTALMSFTTSCGKESRIIEQEPPSPYKNLKEKDDILFNLALSYSERDLEEYGKLLEQEFYFCFARSDYLSGRTLEKWDRASEFLATGHIFNVSAGSAVLHRSMMGDTPHRNDAGMGEVTWGQLKEIGASAASLNLMLSYTAGDTAWTIYAPPDTSMFAGETWYRKDVSVDLTIHAIDSHIYYVADNLSRFFIRYSPGDGIWHIIAWDDLGAQ